MGTGQHAQNILLSFDKLVTRSFDEEYFAKEPNEMKATQIVL